MCYDTCTGAAGERVRAAGLLQLPLQRAAGRASDDFRGRDDLHQGKNI